MTISSTPNVAPPLAVSPPPEPSTTLPRSMAHSCSEPRDYVAKNGFADAVVGLSGGIDSALVTAVAVDALGASHVHGLCDAVALLL